MENPWRMEFWEPTGPSFQAASIEVISKRSNYPEQ